MELRDRRFVLADFAVQTIAHLADPLDAALGSAPLVQGPLLDFNRNLIILQAELCKRPGSSACISFTVKELFGHILAVSFKNLALGGQLPFNTLLATLVMGT